MLSAVPEVNDSRALMLTSFAACGDVNGVLRVIEADPGAVNELGLDGTSPLCAAAMWGHVTGSTGLPWQALKGRVEPLQVSDVASYCTSRCCNQYKHGSFGERVQHLIPGTTSLCSAMVVVSCFFA